MRTSSFAVRLYGALLLLLPPSVRQRDGDEMALLFADLWEAARTPADRVRLLVRTYPQVGAVALAEWVELLDPRRLLTGALQMTGILGQVRQGVRSLRRAPTFACTVIGLVGIGIGSVTAVFTVVDHVLLRSLPYEHVDRLMFVGDGSVRDEWEAHSGPVLAAIESIGSLDGLAIANSDFATLTGGGTASQVVAAEVSEDFFPLFDGRAEMGRLLLEEDFAAADGAVISDGAWQRLFGGEDVLGRSIRIDDIPLTIVGVLRPDFQPPQALVASDVDVYRPINWSLPEHTRIDSEYLEAVARLAPGITRDRAQLEFDQQAERFAAEYPDRFKNDQGITDPLPLVPLQAATVQRVRGGLLLLLGAVGLLLLVSCFNVAHLVLARGENRTQEMAVRRALGAGTGSLVRQLLIESVLLSAAGCVLGLYVAHLALTALLGFIPQALPIGTVVRIDVPVWIFAMLVSLGTAITFGLLPALRVARSDSANHLRRSRSTPGRRAAQLRRGLVIAEVALALVLVTHAGLLARSLNAVRSHDSGLNPAGLLTLPLQHTAARSSTELVATMDEIVRSLETVPGVQSAAYGINLPFEVTGTRRSGWSSDMEMVAGGRMHEEVRLRLMPITSAYFETLGIPMVAGAIWSSGEAIAPEPGADESELPVVLTARTAEVYFGSAERAVGQVIWRDGNADRRWRVTGVAGDTRHWGLDQPVPHGAYLPSFTIPGGFRRAHVAVRVSDANSAVNAALREAVVSAAPGVPVSVVRPMSDWIERSTASRRFDSSMFGLFGAIGLILATTGLYGTLLFSVRQKRREIGVRLAVGATAQQVTRQVVGSGLALASLGGICGLVVAVLSARLLADRLYQVEVADPKTLALSALLLVTTAAVASWIPARGAGRIDPLEALRDD